MKIRSKLLWLSLAVFVLVATLAAALGQHAARGRQLRQLANLDSLQSEAYTRLRTTPLLLLAPQGAGPDSAPLLSERLGALRERVQQTLAGLEASVAEEARWAEGPVDAERDALRALRGVCERWLQEEVRVLEGFPPGTRVTYAHWARAAASFGRRVEPALLGVERVQQQQRAERTALNERVVRRSRTLATLGPALSLGVLLTLLLTVVWPVHRGLRVLLAGARRLGAGELRTEVQLRSSDELAVLAASFNQMARELRESLEAEARAKEAQAQAAERELLHEGALLEDAVRARTAELQTTNQQLSESLRQLREAQEQLHFADRLASVGQLAAGVAHEVNNPLAFVLGNLRFALEMLEAHPQPDAEQRAELLEALREARTGAERVRLIVLDLKVFSRPERDTDEPVDLREVLRVAVNMAGSELRHRARVREALDPAAPRVQGSEARLGQVFLNLLINAAQAIEPGHPERNEVGVRLERTPEGAARVEISDTGAGIAPEALSRIFDPFFTTKPVGMGTGLGLSVCHGIVSALGGSIRVRSQPGQGTTFEVTLPAAGAPGSPSPSPAEAQSAPGPRALGVSRLLVVDDEPAIGALVRRVLGPLAEVRYARSGPEALAQLASGQAFDAVLCDVMMPGMTGLELHAQVAREGRGRERDFIFMTGGALTAEVQRFLDRMPNPTLQKPFAPESLLALLAARERPRPPPT